MARLGSGREVELRLSVSADDLRRRLRDPLLVALAEGPARVSVLRTVYYDTADLALWRSDLVLRVRAVGRRRIVGVKTRGASRGGLVSREESEAPLTGRHALDPRQVPRSALVAAIADPRLRRAVERAAAGRLVPRVETRFRRHTLPLRLGAARIELALDEGEVRAGRFRLPIRELELERLAGPTRALFDVGLRLTEALELRPAPLGKAERGFARLLGAGPVSVRAEPIDLPRGATLDEALRAVLGECLRHLSGNQAAVESGRDAEGVHQMRVGARRMRSALRLFAEWLPPRSARSLSEELRWLAGQLGRARDLDVFLEETLGPILSERRRDAGLVALRAAAEAARREAYDSLRGDLASTRYTRLVLQLGRLAELPGIAAGAGSGQQRRAAPEARRLLRSLARPVRELGTRLEQLSAAELHRLRIRTKRLRYAAELLGPLVDGKASARAARRLSDLQDALGHLNDLANAEQLIGALRAHAGLAPSLATVRAEGFVLGYAARSAAAGRVSLERAWRRAAAIDAVWR